MKYVMLKCDLDGGMVRKVPIVFPDFMIHSEVSEMISFLLMRNHKEVVHAEPVSAGFIELGGAFRVLDGKIAVEDGVSVHGKSESLKLKSDPEDADLIQLYSYNHGVVG